MLDVNGFIMIQPPNEYGDFYFQEHVKNPKTGKNTSNFSHLLSNFFKLIGSFDFHYHYEICKRKMLMLLFYTIVK